MFPGFSKKFRIFSNIAGTAAKGLRFKGDFINRYKKQLPTLKEAQDVITKSNKLARSIKKMVDDIAVQRRGMKKSRVAIVNRMIEVGTSRQVWPADPGIEGRTVKVNASFKELFEKKLTEKEQKLVMDVFKHGETTMAMRREIAKTLKLPQGFFGLTSLEGPYAPLRRTGKHVVILKSQKLTDTEKELEKEGVPSWQRKQLTASLQKLKESSDHFVYKHFLNAGSAGEFEDQQNATGNWSKDNGVLYDIKAATIGDGTPEYGVLQKIVGELESSNVISNITSDPKTQNLLKKAFVDMLSKMYAESLEETSARQGQQRRQGKGISGFDQDMLRSFVVNGSSEANLIANMRYGQEINVALGKIRKEAETIDRETNDGKASMKKVYNMMVFHYNTMLNRKARASGLTDGIASTVTAWTLTTSLSYHLQNATQTIAVAVPIIAADFGSYSQTIKELTTGYAIAHKMVSYDKKFPFLGSKDATWTVNVDSSKAPKELQELLALLEEMELLDLGIEQDLADVNAAETGFASVDATLKGAGTMSHRLYQVPRGVEAYNRISTAITAYNLAVKNPKVMKILDTNPLDYAIKKVQDTQGDFTADGAPAAIKWAINNVTFGKLMVQYRKFPILMAMNYIRSTDMALFGATKEETKIGRRAVRNLVAHTMVLSGLRGLPVIGSVTAGTLFFMSLMGDEDDEIKYNPTSTDGALERRINDMFPDNPKFAEMLYRGPSAAFLGVDTSMKLSHDKIFSLMPFTEFEMSEDGVKDIGMGFMGATGSTILNQARGLEFINNGNYYRGIESMMPKGIRDPMEAWRFMLDGYTKKSGTSIVPPEDFKGMSIILKALGIPDRDIVKMKWKRGEIYQIEQWFQNEQKSLKNRYKAAKESNDIKLQSKIKREFLNLQDGKDRARSFGNNAPSFIPRSSLLSLYNMDLNEFTQSEDMQEQMSSGRFK